MGGAFGSKVSLAMRIAIITAVCAAKLGAPVSITLDRHSGI